MRKLYEKKEILFTLCWILAYCAVTGSIKDKLGFESPAMLLSLLVFSAGILLFVRRNHLEEKYGLSGWPKDTKRYLYFIPMWLLATGNLWHGISPAYQGAAQVLAVLSMILVGFVEEMIFRGFLFRDLRHRAHRQSLHRADERGNGHADHFCRQLGLYPDNGML